MRWIGRARLLLSLKLSDWRNTWTVGCFTSRWLLLHVFFWGSIWVLNQTCLNVNVNLLWVFSINTRFRWNMLLWGYSNLHFLVYHAWVSLHCHVIDYNGLWWLANYRRGFSRNFDRRVIACAHFLHGFVLWLITILLIALSLLFIYLISRIVSLPLNAIDVAHETRCIHDSCMVVCRVVLAWVALLCWVKASLKFWMNCGRFDWAMIVELIELVLLLGLICDLRLIHLCSWGQ